MIVDILTFGEVDILEGGEGRGHPRRRGGLSTSSKEDRWTSSKEERVVDIIKGGEVDSLKVGEGRGHPQRRRG